MELLEKTVRESPINRFNHRISSIGLVDSFGSSPYNPNLYSVSLAQTNFIYACDVDDGESCWPDKGCSNVCHCQDQCTGN